MSEINNEKLLHFINTTKKLIDENPQMNEANTKVKIITHFLELLGWNINFDVELEYSIRAFSKDAKVDYALLIEGIPKVFIEAKGLDCFLGEKEDIHSIEEADKNLFSPGKQVVYIKPGSLFKLLDPIPAGKLGSVPYGLRYTTLNKIKIAKTTEELW